MLHHAGGELTVEVEEGAPDVDATALAVAAGSDEGVTISQSFHPLTGQPLPPNEAIGYSEAWDLREAMFDAIHVLPPEKPNARDWLSRYEVLTTGAEIGGIAGLNRLFVHIRTGAGQ